MKDKIASLINDIQQDKVRFTDVIAFIESHYNYTSTAFKNGAIYNEASQNQGSAKVFSFASLNGLSEQDTLCLFAEHYQAVSENPEGNDHQNIRQFMAYGWAGVEFEGNALNVKS